MEFNLTNLSFPARSNQIQYIEYQKSVFSITDIVIIIGIFAFLAYWYYEVRTNKEKYTKWINPNGKEVNLHKIVIISFWAYVVMIIVLGMITIMNAPK